MPILLLIRHGENDFVKAGRLAGHTTGVHLNDKGREQAKLLADSLAEIPIKSIYSSTLERAIETAEPLALSKGMEIQLRENFVDTDIGNWQGLELKKLKKDPLWKVVQGAPSRMRFPEGETFLECQNRLVNEIEEIVSAHDKEDIIACVFHADPIKLLVAYYLGLPIDNFQRIAIDTASVTILFLSPVGAHLHKLNLTPPFSISFPKKKKSKKKK